MWGFPPAWNISLNCRQSEGLSLFLGVFLHKEVSESSSVHFEEQPELSPPARGLSGLGHISLDPFPRAFHWVWDFTVSGQGPTSSHRPSQRKVPALVNAPPVGVECCWSLSLFSSISVLVTEGAGGHWAWLYSLVASSPKKLAKSVGNCSVSPRLSGRLNWTCCHAGPRGKHLRVDLGREPKCPSVDVRAIPGHTRLTSLSWDPCCCD